MAIKSNTVYETMWSNFVPAYYHFIYSRWKPGTETILQLKSNGKFRSVTSKTSKNTYQFQNILGGKCLCIISGGFHLHKS